MRKIIGLYDNRSEDSKRALYRTLKELPEGEYVYEIKKNRPIKSSKQSNFFHAVCQIYAMYTGHTLQEIKDEFKRDRFFEIVVDKQGKEFKRLKDTAGLPDDEYSALINNLLQWGREKFPDCIIPRKEDFTYKMWLDIQNNYERDFSG